ncbi:MAG: carboxylesterase family protein [Candidatus Saccharibacteria bacterium]|nr:carboxylesterase family protein [Candidatus Saccharibacteria bacterium]
MVNKSNKINSQSGAWSMILMVVIPLIVVFGGLFLALRFAENGRNKKPEIDYQTEFSSANWSYDVEHNVYYQIGLIYADKPVDEGYESMGIYIPGEYLDCTPSGKKYNCRINKAGEKGGFTGENAPMVLSVNTPGYSAQEAPNSYDYNTVAEYIEAGMVYLYPGCRGRYGSSDGRSKMMAKVADYAQGAPWGITDLKAAVRYVRYNTEEIPGNSEAIYAFGHSGGGAQGAILGASGDSELYAAYLDNIGAKMKNRNGEEISDAIQGVMAWNPITALDIANEAYEWNMGRFSRSEGWESELSGLMAEDYRIYVNSLGLEEDGKVLVLDTIDSGSYYNYFMGEMSKSLTNYLHDNFNSAREMKEYIDSLSWAEFSEETGTAKVTDLKGFVQKEKPASKAIAAFDGLERGQTENKLFGVQENEAMHFDERLYEILKANTEKLGKHSGYKDYTREFERDFSLNDSLGKSVLLRSLMYNPMFYLTDVYSQKKCECDENKNDAVVAKNWRIRTGLSQGDTASTTEINLKLALENYGGLTVDFATVWGEGHTEAERAGSASGNFIGWIRELEK